MQISKSFLLGLTTLCMTTGALGLDDQTPGWIRVGPVWVSNTEKSSLELAPGIGSLACEREGSWRFNVDSKGAVFQWLNEPDRPPVRMRVAEACDRCAGEPSVAFEAEDETRLIVRGYQVLRAGALMVRAHKPLGGEGRSARCMALPDAIYSQIDFVQFDRDSIQLDGVGQATLRALAAARFLQRLKQPESPDPIKLQGEIAYGSEEVKLALGETLARTAQRFMVRQGADPVDSILQSRPASDGSANGVRFLHRAKTPEWMIEIAAPPMPGRLDLCGIVSNWMPLREDACVRLGSPGNCRVEVQHAAHDLMRTEQCFKLSSNGQIVSTGALISRHSARLLQIPVLVQASTPTGANWRFYQGWPASVLGADHDGTAGVPVWVGMKPGSGDGAVLLEDPSK